MKLINRIFGRYSYLAVGLVVLVLLMTGSFFAGSRWGYSQARPNVISIPRVTGSPSPGIGEAIGGLPAARMTDSQRGQPIGFPATREGAVAKAVAASRVLGSVRYLQDPGNMQSAYSDLPGEALKQKYQDDFTQLNLQTHVEDLFSSGVPVVFQTEVLAYSVDSYAANKATVRLWQVTVLGIDHHQELRQTWQTVTYSLQWNTANHFYPAWALPDWFIEDRAIQDGPAPRLTQADVGEGIVLPPGLKDFKLL